MTPSQLKDSLVGRQVYFNAAQRDLPAQKGRGTIMDLNPHRYYTILAHEAGDTTAYILDDTKIELRIYIGTSKTNPTNCAHLANAFKWSLRDKALAQQSTNPTHRSNPPE